MSVFGGIIYAYYYYNILHIISSSLIYLVNQQKMTNHQRVDWRMLKYYKAKTLFPWLKLRVVLSGGYIETLV